MKNGIRLDAYLVEKGLSSSREKAKREIIAGWVRLNGETVRVPSRLIKGSEDVRVERPGSAYASRGGEKLERALEAFGVDARGRIVADLGASTGGFTDCLLRRGAALVYAVDVGYGQLAWKLRQDPRVIVMERTNARNLDPNLFEEGIDFSSMDVSFISFLKVLPAVLKVGSDRLRCVILVKPQFEAGREKVGKNGVVRDPAVHEQVLDFAARDAYELGLAVGGVDYSPVKGPEGNIEYLMYLGKAGSGLMPVEDVAKLIRSKVREAHDNL